MTARHLSLSDLERLMNVSKPTIRKWIEEGKFPEGVADANGDVCWSERVVLAWQTLYEVGFFRWPVKTRLPKNDRQSSETTGKNSGPPKEN